ncbi:hypothetical protein FNF27_07611 [Cafeteria roenbergensis]|uniref:Isochorismatase-like domain-containing protein n=2 Tax=Cafeteria roenbergensis TaxID=33653 RepID=A0A5A8DJB7_CAFRO|nr:hypothetical protein FNF29_02980 [Cafeteria roenbergensis]KAA0165603.1 hypothetical protein FNF27_07611 [Cafeteria roenbergensis]|eukprot:KAA0153592.1 hypothetical protein FNF29_02980 [Cafeteria roenbergensis]
MASRPASKLISKAPGVVFLACDMQTRFVPLIFEMESVVRSAVTLCDTAQILGHPIIFTEQYPKAFKHTVDELKGFTTAGGGTAPVFEKSQFSMITDDVRREMDGALAAGDGSAPHAVLFGIEAHVCVQQTALQLLEDGFVVHLVADAVSSQRAADRAAALQLLASQGALVTTTESVMLGLVGGAGHKQFKDVSKRLIQHNAACYTEAGGAHWAKLESDGVTERR